MKTSDKNLKLASVLMLALALLIAWSGPGDARSKKIIHSFGPLGQSPRAGVVMDKNGVLYGTTFEAGVFNAGTVYSLTPPTTQGGTWTEATLHGFGGGNDGTFPIAALLIGNDGTLYGTTFEGGASGNGTAFALVPPTTSGGTWSETILHSFAQTEGGSPQGGLVAAKNGVLYGITTFGSTVYSLTPPTVKGGAWTETVLHEFTADEGGEPTGNLAIGKDGTLYGALSVNGALGRGSVFALAPPKSAGAAWTISVLYAFGEVSGDGLGPMGGVALVADGKLYGTTYAGGSDNCGTLFSLTPPSPAGGTWPETIIRSFVYGADGCFPAGGVTLGKGGSLLGTTAGALLRLPPVDGTLFAFKPAKGENWSENVLAFTGTPDGANAVGALIFGKGVSYMGRQPLAARGMEAPSLK